MPRECASQSRGLVGTQGISGESKSVPQARPTRMDAW